MSTKEAMLRAKAKYEKESVKQVCVKFYPKDHTLLDDAKKRAEEFGGMTPYILHLIKDDLEASRG